MSIVKSVSVLFSHPWYTVPSTCRHCELLRTGGFLKNALISHSSIPPHIYKRHRSGHGTIEDAEQSSYPYGAHMPEGDADKD